MVDGDGTFSITPNNHNNSWQFSFKISLHAKDKQLLALIKKQLKCGSITYAGKKNWQYRVRNQSQLLNIIVPIFLKYPLQTRKLYHFELFHNALLDNSKCAYLKTMWIVQGPYIGSRPNTWPLNNNWGIGVDHLYILQCTGDPRQFSWNKEQKLAGTLEAQTLKIHDNFPAVVQGPCIGLDNLDPIHGPRTIELSKPSFAWIVGFIEAEGSFYITRRHKPSRLFPVGEYCHGFGLSQKHDKHIVEYLQSVFHISAKSRFNQSSQSWNLDTTNKRSVSNIVQFFNKSLLGSKRLEFSLWKRAFLNENKRTNMLYMKDLQQKLRSLRSRK